MKTSLRWSRLFPWFPVGALALCIALVYGQTLGHGFLFFDDKGYVYGNPLVAPGFTHEGFIAAFTQTVGANWHPLTVLSHQLDCELYGLNAAGHHLTNVLLHIACAALLYALLVRLTKAIFASAFAAALFALHPLRVESVAWVAERKDLLCGLFFLLTLHAYVAYARAPFRWSRYLSVLGLFALALMAKPMAVTLPAVLFLLDYWPLARDRRAGYLLREKLPFAMLSLVSCLVTLRAQGTAMTSVEAAPLGGRLANAIVAYAAYLWQLVYPVDLAPLYPYPAEPPPWYTLVGSLAVLGGISALAWRRRREQPYILAGWLWYLGMLVPVIGLVKVGSQAMADRYTYLPGIGIGVLVTWMLREWRLPPRRAALGAAMLLGAWMILSIRQTAYWRDAETLWEHALAVTRGNYVAHSQLGIELMAQGRLEEAIAHYEAALAIHPAYADGENNLGIALATIGQLDSAIAHLRAATQLDPSLASAEFNLSQALLSSQKTAEAVPHLQRALVLEPRYEKARQLLARVLSQSDRG